MDPTNDDPTTRSTRPIRATSPGWWLGWHAGVATTLPRPERHRQLDAHPAVPGPAGTRTSPRRPFSRLDALSARELEVLGLMADGRSNGGIADALVVGAGAVEKHVGNIFTKLGLLPSAEDHRRVLAVLAYLDAA